MFLMKYSISTYTIWEYGQRTDAEGRPHQEDSLYPLPGQMTADSRLFLLCDGMGGHDAGEVASATVCEAMAAEIGRLCPEPDSPFSDEMLNKAVSSAYDALDSRDTNALKKMGTTMTMLKLHPRGATIAHIGDSRVYHIRPGVDGDSTRIMFATSDHSLVNELIKVGELTPEQARDFPQKNVLTRAMQPHQDRRNPADVYHTEDVRPGDVFFMCSDGMLEHMTDDDLKSVFSDVSGEADADKVSALIDMTAENHDNHTAIIVRVNDVVRTVDDVKRGRPMAASPAAAPAAAPRKAAAAQATPPPAASQRKAAPKRRNSTLLYILLAIAAAAVTGVIVYLIKTDGAKTENVRRGAADSDDDDALDVDAVMRTAGGDGYDETDKPAPQAARRKSKSRSKGASSKAVVRGDDATATVTATVTADTDPSDADDDDADDAGGAGVGAANIINKVKTPQEPQEPQEPAKKPTPFKGPGKQ